MAAGLFALLDDVAMLARMAAASVDDVAAAAGNASASAVGVVVDDTAVTPQYVEGLAAERELPIIKKIAIGSLRNKIVFILPLILVLSQFLPIAVTIMLVLGGLYLSYEGAEKVHHALAHRGEPHEDAAGEAEPQDENAIVTQAVRTDFILSIEIMVISLQSVTSEPFLTRAIVLVIVAFLITALVYGVVGLIVKMDDVGLHLVETGKSPALGRRLVALMPKLMDVLSTVGVAAMLWVGGHILLSNSRELGWHGPYDAVHHLQHVVEHPLGPFGGVAGWCVNTLICAVIGIVVGYLVLPLVGALTRSRSAREA